jgi:hypothetical protein
MLLWFRGPRKNEKAQPGAEAASSAACPIGAVIGLHGPNSFIFYRIWLGPDLTTICSSNLKMMLKIEF